MMFFLLSEISSLLTGEKNSKITLFMLIIKSQVKDRFCNISVFFSVISRNVLRLQASLDQKDFMVLK